MARRAGLPKEGILNLKYFKKFDIFPQNYLTFKDYIELVGDYDKGMIIFI